MLNIPVLLLVDYVPELKFYQKVSENFATSGSHKNLVNGCFLANISLTWEPGNSGLGKLLLDSS